jgi:coenzyme F420-reducing hydrogenase delta subunit/Pyruvate/2-oxoacid:ferredoxin oxidoreductase delta subunit
MATATSTLILGNGPCACQVADDLLGYSSDIILATRSNGLMAHPPQALGAGSMELLTETAVVGCQTHQGNFQIQMKNNGSDVFRTVECVVISEEWVREPNFSCYDLWPSPTVLSLSSFMEMENVDERKERGLREKKVVFLTGLENDSNPVIMQDVLETVLTLQSKFQSQTYILTGDLKVAGSGLERLSWEVRKSGAVTFKLNHLLPEVQQEPNGQVTLTYHDEITGLQFSLRPDITVVDESIKPSDYLTQLSRIFRLHTDADGFIQTKNPHRLSVFTNRNGILAAGPSRCIQPSDQQQQDAAAAVIAACSTITKPPVEKAEINSNECVRCLTCYRICPYRAVTFSSKVMVESNRCEGCGICAAECPREAIQIRGWRPPDILKRIDRDSQAFNPESNAPYIVVFGCKHSAGLASETAASMGDVLSENIRMISMPCAGSISMDHILSTFLRKVDGVLILTCRDGNCHSEVGNKYTHQRVKQMANLFVKIGFQKERLEIQTLAANMPFEFIKMVKSFETRIAELGPTTMTMS